MVWPGPSSRARRIAPATLMPDDRPEAQPLMLEQVEQHRHRFVVGDVEGGVDRQALEVGGDPALADALGDRAALGLELAASCSSCRARRRAGRRGRSPRRACAPAAPRRPRRACRRCRRRR